MCCTLKTREFRPNDCLARSTRIPQLQEMQILYCEIIVCVHNSFDIHQKSYEKMHFLGVNSWSCTQTIVTLHRQNKGTVRQPRKTTLYEGIENLRDLR